MTATQSLPMDNVDEFSASGRIPWNLGAAIARPSYVYTCPWGLDESAVTDNGRAGALYWSDETKRKQRGGGVGGQEVMMG